jgi:uncharacterized membrane protein
LLIIISAIRTAYSEDFSMISVEHIHPMLVHFPIALIFVIATIDIVAAMRGVTVTGRTTTGNFSTGLVITLAAFSVLSYIFGGLALGVAEAGGFHSDIAEVHEQLGEAVAIATIVYAAVRAILWWRDTRLTGTASSVTPIVALFGVIMVCATAYYGGQLVYDLGVNVQKIAAT